MKTCIYPGTFDPITNGHLDVLARASRIFGKVVVAVARNAGKAPLFPVDQRMSLIAANVSSFGNVEVDSFDGLLVDFARRRGAIAVIRGLRALSDFENEFQMALMNRHLDGELETLFVMTRDAYSYTSSHLIKQVSLYGADVSPFVPANVHEALKEWSARANG